MSNSKPLPRFIDVAVTFTAPQFHGIYRGKQHHPPDIPSVITRAINQGCSKLLLTTMTLPGLYANHELCQKYPGTCYMTIGIHPYHVGDIYSSPGYLDEMVEFGRKVLNEEKEQKNKCLVAFGEIGLDYQYLDRADKETQKRAFIQQLDLAVEFQLPLFLHVRESTDDFIEILEPYLGRLPKGGLVHSFAGTKEEMLRLVALGLDISVNGVSFKSEAGLEMVREVPLVRLQLETDSPWCEVDVGDARIKGWLEGEEGLAEEKKCNKWVDGCRVKGRNESCLIGRVARVVAGLKGVGVDVVAENAWRNSVRMFGFDAEDQ